MHFFLRKTRPATIGAGLALYLVDFTPLLAACRKGRYHRLMEELAMNSSAGCVSRKNRPWAAFVLPLVAALALVLHFVIFYLNNAMFVLRLEPQEALALPGAAHMLGVILCALACPFLERRAALMAALLLFLAASRLPGFESWLHHEPARLLMTFAYGLSIPLTYSVFFSGVGQGRHGLAYGASVGMGIFATVLFFLITGAVPETLPSALAGALSMADGRLECLFSLHSAGFIALVLLLFVAFLLRRAQRTDTPAPETMAGPTAPGPAAPGHGSAAPAAGPGAYSGAPLARLSARLPVQLPAQRRELSIFWVVVAVFFMLIGFTSASILPVMGHRPFAGSAPWYLLLCAVACPLVGHLLDRRPARGFPAVTRICAFILVLAPSLTLLSGQAMAYAAVHHAATLAQLIFSLSMTLAAARLAGNGPWRCLILCSVYIMHLAALPGVWLFRQSAVVPSGLVVVLSTMAAVLLYELIGRLQSPPGLLERAENQAAGQSVDRVALFHARGLTARECEVAELLMQGLSTRLIAQNLGIAEHTAKTHVRNLLAKFGVSSRKEFLAAMLNA